VCQAVEQTSPTAGWRDGQPILPLADHAAELFAQR
jgi:hypothetical protein